MRKSGGVYEYETEKHLEPAMDVCCELVGNNSYEIACT